MRVTFLAANYPPSVGGAQFLTQRIAEGLAQRHGCSVKVVTTDALLAPGAPDPGIASPRTERLGDVDVERLPVNRSAHAALRKVRYASSMRGSKRFVRFSQPAASGPMGAQMVRAAARAGRESDVVVGVSASFLTLPGAIHVARHAGVPCVTLPLIHLARDRTFAVTLRALPRSDAVVALTADEAEWLAVKGVDPSRVAVIPAGCDPEAFSDLSPSSARRQLGVPERPTVGYIGRMAAHKGVDTLVEAMRQLWTDRPEVNLLLAGNHTGWTGYDEVVENLKDVAGDRLTVIHGFSDAQKSSLFSACDVIAFPSREESFGMVTLEAWSARRPPVVGDIAVSRAIIRSGEDGDLVPVGQPDAWADALLAMLDDPSRRARYGAAGRDRVIAEFGWPTVVDAWHDLLVSTVEQRLRPVRRGR